MADVRIRDLEEIDSDVAIVASKLPGTWKEAIGHDLDHQRAKLVDRLARCKQFEVQELRANGRALDKLQRLLSESAPKHKRRAPQPGQNPDEYMASLARVLTPQGWHETIRPALEKELTAAHQRLLTGEESELQDNQALAIQLQSLINRLDTTEKLGRQALARLAQNATGHRPAGGPRYGGRMVSTLAGRSGATAIAKRA